MSGAGARTRVVIIGGGHAGVAAAQALVELADVKLIEKKGFHEMNWAAVRAPVEPDIGLQSVFAYDDIPKIGQCIVQASAEKVSDHEVTLSTGQTLEFDYLVLAIGTDYKDKLIYNSNGTVDERRQQFQAANDQLRQAESVLLIGGGPVGLLKGVEMAAEVATGLPSKRVTLVTSPSRLLADQPAKMGSKALNSLTKMGVKVITGDKAVPIAGQQGMYRLEHAGTEFHADVVYWCTGTKACSTWLQKLHPDVLDSQGLIKVDDYLRVEGHPNWFAVGDCNNVPETKLGYQAKMQALEVVKNLRSILEHGADTQLAKHRPYTGLWALAVTFGKRDAAMHIKGWSVPWFIPVYLKSHDLFVSESRKQLGMAAAA